MEEERCPQTESRVNYTDRQMLRERMKIKENDTQKILQKEKREKTFYDTVIAQLTELKANEVFCPRTTIVDVVAQVSYVEDT